MGEEREIMGVPETLLFPFFTVFNGNEVKERWERGRRRSNHHDVGSRLPLNGKEHFPCTNIHVQTNMDNTCRNQGFGFCLESFTGPGRRLVIREISDKNYKPKFELLNEN